MWIDTHAHLYDLDTDSYNACISEAADAGVYGMIDTATSLDNASIVAARACPEKRIFAAVGVSPFVAAELADGWRSKLEALLSLPGVIAAGETGLDGSNPCYPSMPLQEAAFKAHIEAAAKKNLPIVIHSRGAEKRAIDMCKSYRVTHAVFHCYTGSLPDLKHLLDCGWHVSFSGIITFKNNPLAELVDFAPLDRILIETDTPYLAPVPHRGQPNRPAWLPIIGTALAGQKKIPVEKAAEQIALNMHEVFGI
jgi:TatD DNase family protein